MSPQDFFSRFSYENLHLADQFYDPQILFIDPLGSHRGIQEVKKYYARLYENVDTIQFEFQSDWQRDQEQILFWTMKVKHPKLNSGREILLDGNSHFKFGDSGLCVYHRDYFDAGEFLYEQIPVFGWIAKKIKGFAKG
jgi:hypothetical protein